MLHTCVMYGLFHNLNTFFSAQTLPDCNNSDSLNHPKGGGGTLTLLTLSSVICRSWVVTRHALLGLWLEDFIGCVLFAWLKLLTHSIAVEVAVCFWWLLSCLWVTHPPEPLLTATVSQQWAALPLLHDPACLNLKLVKYLLNSYQTHQSSLKSLRWYLTTTEENNVHITPRGDMPHLFVQKKKNFQYLMSWDTCVRLKKG